jgi:phage shock protein C
LRVNRRLYRSRTDTVIGGVAAGLASYLNADPALIRVAWAILIVLTGGAALIVYIVCWVVVPEEPEVQAAAEPATDPVTGEVIAPAAQPVQAADRSSSGTAGVVFGIGLVAVGAWLLLRDYLPQIDWSLIWPLVLVGIGALILVTSMRRRAG